MGSTLQPECYLRLSRFYMQTPHLTEDPDSEPIVIRRVNLCNGLHTRQSGDSPTVRVIDRVITGHRTHLDWPDSLQLGVCQRRRYPGKSTAAQHKFYRSLKYHTTADWDYRIQGEKEGEIPPEAKKWLRDVRGY